MNDTDISKLQHCHIQLSDVYDTDPKQLLKHPDNDRLFRRFKTEAQLSELSESIRRYGILEPIILCYDGRTVLSGHSRVMIAKLQHMPTIKVRKILSEHSSEEILEVLAILNLHRMNLTKPERIALYHELYPDLTERLLMPGAKFCTGERGEIGLNATIIARSLHMDPRTVKDDLHDLKRNEILHRRQAEVWNADILRGVNTNAINAVKSYIRKIDEWIATSNEQTSSAITESVAAFSRDLKKRSAKTPS